ncbi:hypothetical protein FOMPIDRAFT_1054201 [Fomitopsis schrenkii]|uniref:Uncharacterized protein n=1 Tax=Fomitopsis schrenkii TaxID=2126942 RepID=S8F9S7_FOMSC|nr:hypothetical protein FOMPIDRAFT_1054201 [Fomitopsis schrenkii]
MSEADASRAAIFGNRVITATAALYFYDKLLVCRQEADLIWRRERCGLVVCCSSHSYPSAQRFIVLIANVVSLACYIPNSVYANKSQVSMVAIVLTTVSLSRLLLNLRGLAYGSDVLSAAEGSASRSRLSSLDFSHFAGSLGSAVADGSSGMDQEDMGTDDALGEGNATTIDSTAAPDIELVRWAP